MKLATATSKAQERLARGSGEVCRSMLNFSLYGALWRPGGGVIEREVENDR
jgi:hypothetical protein